MTKETKKQQDISAEDIKNSMNLSSTAESQYETSKANTSEETKTNDSEESILQTSSGFQAPELIKVGDINEEINSSFTITDLLDMGIHFGHDKKFTQPIMRKNYIYCSANGLDIFNLETTETLFKQALKKIYDVIMEGKSIILICTKKSSSAQLIKDIAERCGQFFVTRRWIPGFLTNKDTMKKSIDKLKYLQTAFANSKAPSKVKRLQATDLHKRTIKLEGINNCKVEEIGAVVSIYCDNLGIVAHECKIAGIPLIAVCDSNTKDKTIKKVNYVIPGNDDAVKSHFLYASVTDKVIRRGFENFLLKPMKKMEGKKNEDQTILRAEDLVNAQERKFQQDVDINTLKAQQAQ